MQTNIGIRLAYGLHDGDTPLRGLILNQILALLAKRCIHFRVHRRHVAGSRGGCISRFFSRSNLSLFIWPRIHFRWCNIYSCHYGAQHRSGMFQLRWIVDQIYSREFNYNTAMKNSRPIYFSEKYDFNTEIWCTNHVTISVLFFELADVLFWNYYNFYMYTCNLLISRNINSNFPDT